MSRLILFLILGLIVIGNSYGQDTLKQEYIPTLNRVAEEYDKWKLIYGIATVLIAVWSFFGLRLFIKTKAEDWVMTKIAKESDLKVEHIKAAVKEFAHLAELKKRKILVISAKEGQQGIKKVLDGGGFSNFEWESITNLSSIVLNNTDLILINDAHDMRLTQDQIESIFDKFTTTVAYQYFGPNNKLPIDTYRNNYPGIQIGLCNSADRLETGILSLLKIV